MHFPSSSRVFQLAPIRDEFLKLSDIAMNRRSYVIETFPLRGQGSVFPSSFSPYFFKKLAPQNAISRQKPEEGLFRVR